MTTKATIAGVQMEAEIFQVERNLEKALDLMGTAHENGARIAVFPECAPYGYKIHLPWLGLDTYVAPGDLPLRMYPAKYGRQGQACPLPVDDA